MNDFYCPICKKKIPAEQAESSKCFPFCSERCKMVDLGKWLDGQYVIREPSQSDDDDR